MIVESKLKKSITIGFQRNKNDLIKFPYNKTNEYIIDQEKLNELNMEVNFNIFLLIYILSFFLLIVIASYHYYAKDKKSREILFYVEKKNNQIKSSFSDSETTVSENDEEEKNKLNKVIIFHEQKSRVLNIKDNKIEVFIQALEKVVL